MGFGFTQKKLVIWFLGLIPSHTKFWFQFLKFRVCGSCFGSYGAIHTWMLKSLLSENLGGILGGTPMLKSMLSENLGGILGGTQCWMGDR